MNCGFLLSLLLVGSGLSNGGAGAPNALIQPGLETVAVAISPSKPDIAARDFQSKSGGIETRSWYLLADWWVAIGTICLAVFTGLLWIFTARMWRETQRLANDAEAQNSAVNRAFVFLDGFTVDLRSNPETLSASYMSLIPRWKNSGNTPTKGMKVKTRFGTYPTSLPDDFSYEYSDHPSQYMFLGPRSVQHADAISIPPGSVNAHVNGGLGDGPRLYVWGTAEYEDIFNKKHYTNWCYRLFFLSKDAKNIEVQFIQRGPYNRTDEDG